MDLCLEDSGDISLLATTAWSEWTAGGWSDSETKVLSPGQAVEFNVLVVDKTLAVDLDECETTETRVGWVGDAGNAVELPLPDNGVAVVDDVDSNNVFCARLAEGVIDVDGSVGLDDGAKLRSCVSTGLLAFSCDVEWQTYRLVSE